MSNHNPLFQDLSFDPEEITAVNQAYDLACQTLQNIGQLEVDREIIARGILQAARSGERDANKLCERAIHGLTALDIGSIAPKTTNAATGFRFEDGDSGQVRWCEPMPVMKSGNVF